MSTRSCGSASRLAAIIVLSAAACAACAAPTESCAPPADLSGTWTYASEQQAGGLVTASGTFTVDHQACRDFDGAMDVIETDTRGQRAHLTGRVTGQILDAHSFQFDAWLGAVPRQHLATITGDSVSGSWLEVSGTTGAGGSFRGRHEARQ